MNLLDSAFGESVDLNLTIIETAVPDVPLVHKLLRVEESGINTTSAFIERQGEVISIVPSAPRGGVGQPLMMGKRDGVTVEAVHLPVTASVFADEVQSRRAFGTNQLDSVEALRTFKLAAMKKHLIWTQAQHLLGALRGEILDADGSVLLDLHALWGTAPQTVSFDLANAGTNLTVRAIEAQRKAEDALGGSVPRGYIGLASPSFMDALRQHSFYERVLQFAAPSKISEDYRSGIVIGDSTFVEVRSPADWPVAIDENTALLVPDVAALLVRKFAPADWVETVNTEGVPFYAKSELLPMGRGYRLEAQTNPITLVSRPAAVIKVTAE